LAFPGDVADACTNIQEEEEEKDMLTHDAMRGFGLTSLVVCNTNRLYNIKERNVTIKSEI
jgi:hypothetical protein